MANLSIHSTVKVSDLIGQNAGVSFVQLHNSGSCSSCNMKLILMHLLCYVLVPIVTTRTLGHST